MKNKRNTGITLIALVITIIILLILSGTAIATLAKSGLLKNAQKAKEESKKAELKQEETIGEYEEQTDKYLQTEPFKGTTVAEAVEYAKMLNKNENTELQDAKGNKIVVPAGFKITNDATTVDKGIVIEDATSGETAGNQFVWVPVGTITKEDGSKKQ